MVPVWPVSIGVGLSSPSCLAGRGLFRIGLAWTPAAGLAALLERLFPPALLLPAPSPPPSGEPPPLQQPFFSCQLLHVHLHFQTAQLHKHKPHINHGQCVGIWAQAKHTGYLFQRSNWISHPFELVIEGVCALQEPPLLLLVPVLRSLKQLCFKLPLFGNQGTMIKVRVLSFMSCVFHRPNIPGCTMRDWTWRLRTCMRAVVTTERTSGTTTSLRMSLMSRWFLWKRAAAICFMENPSS